MYPDHAALRRKKQPEFANKCNFASFEGKDIFKLAFAIPRMAELCNLDRLYESTGSGNDVHSWFADLLITDRWEISRLGIDEDVLSLIDNPMFQKNVYLAVSYNTYSRYRNTFIEDYNFAFTQDFSHINDIFQKIDAIYNEGFSHYLIVTDCRDDDKDYFINYKNEVMSVLMFEEE